MKIPVSFAVVSQSKHARDAADLHSACFRYCTKLQSANFWGGEVELLVLSKMLHTPIYVYKTAQEGGRSVFTQTQHLYAACFFV